jgi:hypothetical protein
MIQRIALIGAVVILAACADSPTEPTGIQASYGRDGDGNVSKPFRASLFTGIAGLAPDPACGDPPRFLNTQVGEGEATHLGRFSVVITFCIDATDVLDDGQLTEGESLPYDQGVGTLIAANGDELYLSISGAVLPSDHPDFDFEFHDPFSFTGGTGRFEGATGGGSTDSYVDQAADRTEHDWTGRLVIHQ